MGYTTALNSIVAYYSLYCSKEIIEEKNNPCNR